MKKQTFWQKLFGIEPAPEVRDTWIGKEQPPLVEASSQKREQVRRQAAAIRSQQRVGYEYDPNMTALLLAQQMANDPGVQPEAAKPEGAKPEPAHHTPTHTSTHSPSHDHNSWSGSHHGGGHDFGGGHSGGHDFGGVGHSGGFDGGGGGFSGGDGGGGSF